MQSTIEIRYLIAVVTLAEELNYTRAARRLRMSQSGLSRRIQDIELKLDVKLFHRDRGPVELTDAGRAFVEEARLAILHDERAIQFARSVNGGAENVLEIGRSPDIDPALVEMLFSLHLPLYPNLKIHLHSEFSADLTHGLLNAHLDVALITQPAINPRLTTVKLAEAPLYAVVSEDHLMAQKESLKLKDLSASQWVVLDRRIHPTLYDQMMRTASDAGFQPREIHSIMNADEAFHLLSANGGVAFLTKASALRIATRGWVARPLDEKTLSLDEHLAARADNPSKLVSEFVRTFVKRMKSVLQPLQMSLPIRSDVLGPPAQIPQSS
jgi:DNA-binding transcriptional LysR family regulator